MTVSPDDSVPAAFLAEVRRREAANAADEDTARYFLAGAIAYYELAVARDPYDRDAHLAYGALIGRLGGTVSLPDGSVRSDIELLDRAHRADPSDVRAVQALGGRLFGESRLDEERAVLARWLPQCRVSSRRDPEAVGRLLTRPMPSISTPICVPSARVRSLWRWQMKLTSSRPGRRRSARAARRELLLTRSVGLTSSSSSPPRNGRRPCSSWRLLRGDSDGGRSQVAWVAVAALWIALAGTGAWCRT